MTKTEFDYVFSVFGTQPNRLEKAIRAASRVPYRLRYAVCWADDHDTRPLRIRQSVDRPRFGWLVDPEPRGLPKAMWEGDWRPEHAEVESDGRWCRRLCLPASSPVAAYSLLAALLQQLQLTVSLQNARPWPLQSAGIFPFKSLGGFKADHAQLEALATDPFNFDVMEYVGQRLRDVNFWFGYTLLWLASWRLSPAPRPHGLWMWGTELPPPVFNQVWLSSHGTRYPLDQQILFSTYKDAISVVEAALFRLWMHVRLQRLLYYPGVMSGPPTAGYHGEWAPQ